MPKKVANIHKRKDGRWEGRYKIGSYENGNTKYRSVYGKSYREVKDKLSQVQYTSSKVALPKSRDKMFSDVLKMWLNDNLISIKESTAYKYEYLINKHIIPELGYIKASELTSTQINAFLDRKLKSGRLDKSGGLSASYVKTIMLVIQSAIQFGVEAGYCPPLKTKINKPIETTDELTILDKEKQKRLEAYLLCERSCTAIGIVISLHTGLRIGEICALSWQDIDLRNQIIHVRHTVARVCSEDGSKNGSRLIIDSPKTKSSKRDIPISSFLLPLLTEMKETTVSEFVVSNQKEFVSPRTYEYRYHRLLTLCGIESINYHALRHTFATRCIEAGVDVKSLSEILGHSNVAITLNTYVHSSMSLKRTQLEKLSGYTV